RKLSGAVFNASIPQPKCTEYSPPVHHFTLPAPEYRRSHVAVKFSSARRGLLYQQDLSRVDSGIAEVVCIHQLPNRDSEPVSDVGERVAFAHFISIRSRGLAAGFR